MLTAFVHQPATSAALRSAAQARACAPAARRALLQRTPAHSWARRSAPLPFPSSA